MVCNVQFYKQGNCDDCCSPVHENANHRGIWNVHGISIVAKYLHNHSNVGNIERGIIKLELRSMMKM